nr:glycosyltransferase family 39 protein [Candidatus Chloroploca mongolica]
MPFGLWRDEARHGLFAQRIRDYPDYRPIYIANENLDASQLDLNAAPLSIHLPALGLYPFALALHLWGENLWSMRVMSGLGGALTVVPLYGFATWLSGRRSIGLVAAFLLAVSSWHITVSRLVFPTIFDPLLTLSGLWLLGLGLSGGGRTAHVYPPILSHTTGSPLARGTDARPGHHRFFWMAYCLLGGASIGLAMQTYHTGRLAPVAAAWLALVLLLREPRAWRGWLRGSLVASLGLLLTVTPLLLFALNQPEAFNDRVGQVFLLSDEARQGAAPLEMLDQSLHQHLLMFHVQGDLNGRHHAPGRPMFDYVTGIGLLLGSVVLLRSARDWRTLIVAGLFLLGLAPSALAVDAPHGMRSLNAAAYGVIIAALGWNALGWSLRQRGVQLARGMRRSIVAMLASLVIVLNATVYFVVMPPQREVFLVFYPVQSQMGAYIRAVANENGGELPRQIYVAEGLKNDQIFMFLTSGLHIETFRGASLSAPPEPGALFLFGGYFADEEAALLAPILGLDAAPTGSGPAFPDGQGVTFYMYEVGVLP